MAIPVDSEGRFIARDSSGSILGEGTVVDGTVTFGYGPFDGEKRTIVAVMPVPEFESTWAILPQARNATLEAGVG